MNYREFLQIVALVELSEGKDGIRHVGEVQFDKATNEFRLGLIVPDDRWIDSAEWEASDGVIDIGRQ